MKTILLIWALFTSQSLTAGLYEHSPLKTLRKVKSPPIKITETECDNKLADSTRRLLFDYFTTAAHNNLDAATAEKNKFAKLAGMIYKESSGNPTAYTDMKYNGIKLAVSEFYKRKEMASIDLFNLLRKNQTVRRNYQTNFGLLQISIDTLTWGKNLRPIFEDTIKNASERPEKALEICGTKEVFTGSDQELLQEMMKYKNCKLLYRTKYISEDETRPIISDEELACFESWVTYCPNLNLAIGEKLSMKFYESRNAPPLCQEELNLLLKKVKGM